MMQGKLVIYMQKTETIHSRLSGCTKISSKWIKDLNVTAEIVKLLQEKNRENSGRCRHR
jgi:hypothetical protein